MTDPRIYTNPIPIIRHKRKDGTFLYSEEECLRLLEIFLDRAKKVWKEEAAEKGRPADTVIRGVPVFKPSGRGRVFWIDSE
jgi:hypothetical protein